MRAMTQIAISTIILTITSLLVTPAWAQDELPLDVIQLIKIDACTAIEKALEIQPSTVIEVELDTEHGQPVYEIEIMADQQTKEINVHAITGTPTRDSDD